MFCARVALSRRGGFEVCELGGGEDVLAERVSEEGRFEFVRLLLFSGRFELACLSDVLLRLGEFAGREADLDPADVGGRFPAGWFAA